MDVQGLSCAACFTSCKFQSIKFTRAVLLARYKFTRAVLVLKSVWSTYKTMVKILPLVKLVYFRVGPVLEPSTKYKYHS